MRHYALLALIAAAGCSGGTTSSDLSIPSDLSVPHDLAAPAQDLAMSPSLDGGGVDMAMFLSGTGLAPGNYSLVDITSDGFVVYLDNDSNDAYAIAVAGGMPTKIAAGATGFVILGKVVFVWSNGDMNGNGALTAWTSAGGAKAISTLAGANSVGASSDGSLIAWIDHFDANAMTGDLVIDKSDHSAEKVLFKGVDTTGGDGCLPIFGFVGARLVASHCFGSAPDGGVPSISVTSYDVTGTGIDLATGASSNWQSDVAGTMVLVKTVANVGSIVPVGGGKATVTGIMDLKSGLFAPDGSAVVYSTNAGGMARVATAANSMSVALQMKGVDDVDVVSPDGKTVLFHSMSSPEGLLDMLATSAVNAGAVTTLNKDASVPFGPGFGNLFGDSFTADSSQAIFLGGFSFMTFTGNAEAAPIAGAAKMLAANSSLMRAVTGTKVIYNANGAAGPADLFAIDLANGAPTLIASQAGPLCQRDLRHRAAEV